MNEGSTPTANARLYVDRSPIHGQGLFANQPIKADELIGTYEGPFVYEEEDDGMYVLWVLDEDGEGYGVDGKNEMRFMNHSDEPNAVFDEVDVYALRDIAPGEEITVSYGADWEGIEQEEWDDDEWEEVDEEDVDEEDVEDEEADDAEVVVEQEDERETSPA